MNYSSAAAFKTVVEEIAKEIFDMFRKNPNLFYIHPTGQPVPRNNVEFRRMFQAEINDANTASVVSGALGMPIVTLSSCYKQMPGKRVHVNQTQINKLSPNMRKLVQSIE